MANPSLSTLIRIAEALNVQPSDFFNEPVALDQLILRSHQRKKITLPDNNGLEFDELTLALKDRIELEEI